MTLGHKAHLRLKVSFDVAAASALKNDVKLAVAVHNIKHVNDVRVPQALHHAELVPHLQPRSHLSALAVVHVTEVLRRSAPLPQVMIQRFSSRTSQVRRLA